MGAGADLLLMRETANLPLSLAAKCLGVGSFELRLLEQHGHGITDEMLAGVRTVYRANQLSEPALPREEEYIPGTTEQAECSHHWIIDSPAGPQSDARCLKCGSERTFLTGEKPPSRVRPPPVGGKT